MPELPECEVVVKGLQEEIVGREVVDYSIAPSCKENMRQAVEKSWGLGTIKEVFRRGKFIIFSFERGFFVSHLRMTGKWLLSNKKITDKHWLVEFYLSSGEEEHGFLKHLVFSDVRKFGTLNYYKDLNDCEALNRLGPDGLELNNSEVIKTISKKAAKSKRPIKNFLLDQSVIAGVGNIYASESLYLTRTRVTLPAREAPIPVICEALHGIFHRAIELGGSSLSNYVDITGQKGSYHNHLKVYGRKGLSCMECGDIIGKLVMAGRSTFFCPTCQK